MNSPSLETLVIAVDCSTTAAKAIVVDGSGRVHATGSHPLHTATPAPRQFEQDPHEWWEATDAAVREALVPLPDRSAVRAICVTHQRESFVCLDARGRALRPAMLWLDGRASEQVARYGNPHVEELSGKPADITPGLYKLAWLRENEPHVLHEARHVVDVHGFLAHELTGRWVTSTASMDPLALLDVSTARYCDELLEIAGVRREQLPELVAPGETLGPLRGEISTSWGLAPDVQVVAGLGDGQAAGLGADVTGPGRAYLVLGTAVVIGSQSRTYRPSRDYRSLVSPVPGAVTVETFSSSGTFLPTWFRQEFGRPELEGCPDPALEAAAAAVPIGSDNLMTLPYWNAAQTPHWDALASGATIGWRPGHGRAHFYRSLLEGISCELRLQLDGLETATGRRVELLRSTGGGARSGLWTQILADVLGRPLQTCAAGEISALGAAALALTAVGEHTDVHTAASAMARTDGLVEPRGGATARYEEILGLYRTLYPTLRETLHHLNPPRNSRTRTALV